jgi:hypothetical protein
MFVEEERICANTECSTKFVAKVYNTIYCSPECRKIVTNKKLLENYYEKKNNKNKKRICKTQGCGTILSRYNQEKICEACKKERFIKRLASWGWDEEKLRKETQ